MARSFNVRSLHMPTYGGYGEPLVVRPPRLDRCCIFRGRREASTVVAAAAAAARGGVGPARQRPVFLEGPYEHRIGLSLSHGWLQGGLVCDELAIVKQVASIIKAERPRQCFLHSTHEVSDCERGCESTSPSDGSQSMLSKRISSQVCRHCQSI